MKRLLEALRRLRDWLEDRYRRLAVAVAAVAVAVAATGCSYMNETWHHDCKVIAKDTLYSGSGGDTSREYRLSTSCGTFEVGDSLNGGFSSWDKWQQLQEGKSYDLKTGGYRVGFFSAFPTLLEIRER